MVRNLTDTKKKKIGHEICKSETCFTFYVLCVRELPICLKNSKAADGGLEGGLRSSGYWPYRQNLTKAYCTQEWLVALANIFPLGVSTDFIEGGLNSAG